MAKMPKAQTETDHLEWLVRCRSQNQNTSLLLYKLLTENSERLSKDSHLATAGVSLVAISFNLWRAVFLADLGDSPRNDRVDHAVAFLKTLISDNAIAYAQDKNARAWTCWSYLNNAAYRLEGLCSRWNDILPNFTRPKNVTVKALWERLQENTDLAVGNFANALKNPLPSK